ncbi:restriction endonuclease subunit S [Flammeovirga kamogawensis]|uniref:Restriction endonuclease subunit S n=1 Tax=Flammeovirga kamogawensis TaxID=373891 RepID=A0ABX8H0U2_9BACT|nr:restriction endonuclease subunit S [Flammeovirga kamogawensis]MBB6462395.1 type I restriction enzyme S subunit [Flammeovirga kamogawensis]QWG09508.1 restriction endonuclease subunit S [Flammeovirga kamogawensis]TRX65024.1 restriction endonuclease subunit S [Flammeovirga kamogawensis]
MTEVKNNIPVLRFPEFSGEWAVPKFGEKYNFYTTNSLSRDKLNYEGGSVKNLHYGDIHTKFQAMFSLSNEYVPFINEDVSLAKIKEESYCKEGDLVIADASEDYNDIGKSIELINLNTYKVLAGLHTLLARPKEDFAKGFTGYSLQSWTLRKQIMVVAQGTKVLGLSTKQLAKVTIPTPTLPEQQKIADFLSSVDKKIGQLEEKKSLLEEYKKGVMQKIFSREIRFKADDGSEFEEWEEINFGDLYKFISTNSLSREKLNYEIPNVYNIHYGDIHTKFKSQFSFQDEIVPYINTDVSLSKIKPEAYCEVGDLVIADASEDYADIGKLIEVKDLNNKKVLAGLHTFLARQTNSKKIYNGFLSHYAKSWKFRKQMMFIAQGTKVLSISTGRVSKIKIELPSFPEQQKIANFLTSLDRKIEVVGKELEGVKEWKKGLLQGMFV